MTGSVIQGAPQLLSRSEASLASYHGNFIDGAKWEVENPNRRALSGHSAIKSKHSLQVQGESQKTGLRQWGENTFVCCAEGCQWSRLLFLLLSEDPGSAEVKKRGLGVRCGLESVQPWRRSTHTTYTELSEGCWREGQGSLEFSWHDQTFVFWMPRAAIFLCGYQWG